MNSEIEHEEKWTLRIRRDPDDDWPDVAWHGRARRLLRPSMIFVAMRRGDNEPRISVRGKWHLQDGTPTGHDASMAIFGDRAPWVAPIVELVRSRNSLGPGETGVGLVKKIYAVTSQHETGTRYQVNGNSTAGCAPGEIEIVAIPPWNGEGVKEDEFGRSALVLRGISRLKAEAICLILNAPEE